MRPVLGWKVIEGQQDLSVFGQTLGRFWILSLIGFNKPVKGLIGIGFGLGSIDLPQGSFGLRLKLLGKFVEDIGGLMDPTSLRSGGGKYFR